MTDTKCSHPGCKAIVQNVPAWCADACRWYCRKHGGFPCLVLADDRSHEFLEALRKANKTIVITPRDEGHISFTPMARRRAG